MRARDALRLSSWARTSAWRRSFSSASLERSRDRRRTSSSSSRRPGRCARYADLAAATDEWRELAVGPRAPRAGPRRRRCSRLAGGVAELERGVAEPFVPGRRATLRVRASRLEPDDRGQRGARVRRPRAQLQTTPVRAASRAAPRRATDGGRCRRCSGSHGRGCAAKSPPRAARGTGCAATSTGAVRRTPAAERRAVRHTDSATQPAGCRGAATRGRGRTPQRLKSSYRPWSPWMSSRFRGHSPQPSAAGSRSRVGTTPANPTQVR